jgi:non-specific serine/threonine protein kinase
VESIQPGQHLGHYRIVSRLGAGGMGEVFRAEDLRLERPVAIKLLPPALARDSEAVERLTREARSASSLHHPGIVSIFAIEETDGVPYIVMELVEGETLQERIKRGALDSSELVSIGAQIAEAIGAAHQVGLIHRDIKPSNVLLTSDGRAKLADFGVAKRVHAPSADPMATAALSLTATGALVGTFLYMSPEQSRGEVLDTRSDIFSLGVVLYEAATGRLPFEGPTALSVLHEIALVEPPAPSRMRPGLQRKLDHVLLRAMAKDRERRYATAEELAGALREALSEEAETMVTRPDAMEARSAAIPNNLPPALTSFVGRRDEMEEVGRHLRSARLVTLTGAGGCGKSRLSIQIAQNLLQSFPDGAWLAELAPLSDPSLVVQGVAGIFGIREIPGRPLLQTLKEYLSDRTFLLILDNCEHLIPGCFEIARTIVEACRNARVLATSRMPLGVPGEIVWRVPPLRIPATATGAPRKRSEVGAYESVRLFVERASTAMPQFALTDENAEPIAQICSRLDGIPLAIELAAARIKVLPAGQILARLESRFRLLTGGSLTALPHQQTLRAAVDWSYELLTDPERSLFQRLSVFAGGATLEAVESVCSGEGISEDLVLDLMTQLVDRSLVIPEEGAGGTARYRLLETLREYGKERMVSAGLDAAYRERHGAYFLRFAEAASPELMGPSQRTWLDRLEEEHDNFRHALAWAASGGSGETALRLASALDRFWWMHGHWNEGRRQLEQILSSPAGSVRSEARAEALQGAAVLARRQGAQAVAERHLNESLAIRRELGNPRGIASTLQALGSLAHDRGHGERAQSLYEESLAMFRELKDRRSEAGVLHNLGNEAQAQGRYDAAASLFQEALEINREIGNTVWEAMALNGLGSVARDRGELREARAFHEQALALQRQLGDRRGISYTSGELGSIACSLGSLEESRSLLEENLRIVRDLGDSVWVADSLERFAVLAAVQGHAERALRLTGSAAALRDAIGVPLTESERAKLDRDLAPARTGLGEEKAGEAFDRGRRISVEAALSFALSG